ncbi:MAG: hypothetical protein ACE5NM_05945 [Sedimentisphaerales bacterium]
MTDINGILSKGEVVRNHLLQMLHRKGYASQDISNLLAAYTDLALEHHESIYLLIDRKLYGSAFALVRPLFDTFYRAHWVCGCATKEQVHEICNNDSFQFPKMSDMVRSIDEKYASDRFFSSIKDSSWPAMCSYTHSGLLAICRRFTGNTIKPNYSEGEILEVLNSTNVVIIFVTRLFFIATNQAPEVKETEKLILEL